MKKKKKKEKMCMLCLLKKGSSQVFSILNTTIPAKLVKTVGYFDAANPEPIS